MRAYIPVCAVLGQGYLPQGEPLPKGLPGRLLVSPVMLWYIPPMSETTTVKEVKPFDLIVLSSAASISGGLRQAVYLAGAFSQLGYTVTIFVPFPENFIKIAPELDWRILPDSMREAEKALRAVMPEGRKVIVHAFHNKGVKLAAWLGTWWRFCGLPVACAAHRGLVRRPGNPLPYLLPGIRAYMVNSNTCGKVLPLFWRRNRCHLVANGVPHERVVSAISPRDMRERLGIPVENFVLGCVCNNNPQKGAGVCITAFASARSRLPAPSTLIVVGVQPESWLPLCVALGVAEHVRLVPPADHVAEYVQLFDLMVCGSYFAESQPNVLLEGMLMGRAIVSSRAGGIPDLLADEWLVPQQNPQALADKIVEVATNPELLRRSAAENARLGQQYTMEARVAASLAIYQSILAE